MNYSECTIRNLEYLIKDNLYHFGVNWLKYIKKSYNQMTIVFILYTTKDCTGYTITENLRTKLGSLFTISAGTVYPQLNKLEEDGIVYSEKKSTESAVVRPDDPRKVYQLTKFGLSIIDEVQDLWTELIRLSDSYIDEINIIKEEGFQS